MTYFHRFLTDFLKLEDIHQFYADLMNIIYDKDITVWF
jgi:GTP1/Obg family GTP-binding protein